MIIFLLKRRSELRSLDATAGSTALTSANEYIATLQRGEKEMRGERNKMQARSEALQKQWDSERSALTDALAGERHQMARLTANLERCKAALAVAESEFDALVRRDRASAHHRRPSAE